MSRTIFVTGTDTGVGKTLLTALLLHHLRATGIHALATKPFCSGGMGDVELLQQVQGGELSAREINPFYFPEPLAPLVAARRQRRRIKLTAVLENVRNLSRKADCLLVEGAGGLLAPLGEGFSLADVIEKLGGDVIVVGANRLGVLNHVLLTVGALRGRGMKRIQVVLMGRSVEDLDPSAGSNEALLRELVAPIKMAIHSIPFLGPQATRFARVKGHAKKIKKTLARISSFASLSPRSLERLPKGGPNQTTELGKKPC